jgi:hypothetical protein
MGLRDKRVVVMWREKTKKKTLIPTFSREGGRRGRKTGEGVRSGVRP